MNVLSILFLSFRNYVRNYSRYAILILSLTLVIALFIIILALGTSFRTTLFEKTARYFAGDIVVQAYDLDDGSRFPIRDSSMLDAFASEREGIIHSVVKRSIYLSSSQLFFNGQYIIQRRVIGVNWDEGLLAELSIVEGALPEKNNTDAILISRIVAENLKVHVGDELILTGKISGARQNTHTFVVTGIFSEGSIFDYASYVHQEAINTFLDLPADYINEIGLYTDKLLTTTQHNRLAQELWDFLSQNYELLSLQQSRYERNRYINSITTHGLVHGIFTLSDQLSELEELSLALNIIFVILQIIFSLLLFIGITNTFSMILVERRQEIGTLRSLGLYQRQVITLFMSESFFLTLNGVLFGIVLAAAAISQIHVLVEAFNIDLPEIVLENGRIAWEIKANLLLLISASSIVSCLLGVLRVALPTSKIPPQEALNQY